MNTNPETILVSVDMAKKLLSAGWNKPTVFLLDTRRSEIVTNCYHDEDDLWLPSAEEILWKLPFEIVYEVRNGRTRMGWLVIRKNCRTWNVSYECLIGGERAVLKRITNTVLVLAAAQMWLWCVERGYIKPGAKP